MSNASDFVIEDGILTKYVGPGGDVVIPDGVKRIGAGGFFASKGLMSIIIPPSVFCIGPNAFMECSDLKRVSLPDGLQICSGAFIGCVNLFEINASDSIMRLISEEAFFTGLEYPVAYWMMRKRSIGFEFKKLIKKKKEVFLKQIISRDDLDAMIGYLSLFRAPDIYEIDKYLKAAENTLSIKTFLLDYKANHFSETGIREYYDEQIQKELGAKEYTLKDWKRIFRITIKKDGGYISGYLLNDSFIVVPNNVGQVPLVGISNGAFASCETLSGVLIETGIISIGNGAFADCSSLESISIPDSVTNLGISAFSHCVALTNITIPDSVTSIGDWAFNGCTGLTSVTIPAGMMSIGDGLFKNCVSLISVIIPDGVTSVGYRAFDGCTGLMNVTIPGNMKKISERAFSGCTGLTSITIPDSVTDIGDYAFFGCTGLTSTTIPDSVTSIGSGTFSNCNQFTIHAHSGSAAEKYARENNINFEAI